jgi:hypothetical protein
MTKVYVAGAWSEQFDRVKPMMARLREAGATITHDWMIDEATFKAGGSDTRLSDEEQLLHAKLDAAGVVNADVFWLMISSFGRGSYVELGMAWAIRQFCHANSTKRNYIVVSGPAYRCSIFTSLADARVATDEEGLRLVLDRMATQ